MLDSGNAFLSFLASNWLLLAGLAILLVLGVSQRQEARRRERALQEQLEAMRETLQQELTQASSQQQAQGERERESFQAGLHGFNDSVVRIMGEMSRTQQGQLDSFGGQIRATSRVEEERMERMRVTVEERMLAYEQHMNRFTQVLDEKMGTSEQRLDRVTRVIDEKLSTSEQRIDRLSQTLDQKLVQNEQRMDGMRGTLEQGLTRMQEQNQQKLEEMRVTVDEKLHTTLDRRLNESFQLVVERLEQVSKGLGEMQSLASGVGDLKKVLTNVKTRGTWGEVQLGALLEQILAPNQYRANVAVRPNSAERVDYAVVLPGKGEESDEEVFLPIDAKFPQEDYHRLIQASERGAAEEVEAATKALEAAIRVQARRIHEKYVDPPHTTDYAIMFLPTEGLYAEVLRGGTLAESLQQQYRIIITGPTTLAALLNSLQMGFRTLAIERRSSEVWRLLGAVRTEFGRFSDLLSKTQRKLQQASDSIEDAAKKTRTIQRKLQNVAEIPERDARRMLSAGAATETPDDTAQEDDVADAPDGQAEWD